MQINLIPKTKELEERKKQINFLIFVVSAGILIATGVVTGVIYGINLTRGNSIKDYDKKISNTNEEIAKFKDIEDSVNTLVTGLDNIKAITDTRKDWGVFLTNFSTLMPRETWLESISIEPNKAIFKIKTNTAQKASEFMKALTTYEFVPKTAQAEEENKDEKQEPEKVKLFTRVDISKYSRYFENDVEVLQFEVEADFTEDVWPKN